MRTSTEPVGLTRTSADSHRPTPRAERADRLRRRDAARLDVGREADAAQLAVARRLALALADTLVVGKLHRLLERRVIVAGVVGHDHRRLVRERLDEVLAPQIRRIHAHLARADLDQPLDHEGRFRPPCPAIGVDRHGVGVDRIDLAIDLRDLVLARQQRARRDRSAPPTRRSTCRRRDWRSSCTRSARILPSASNAISAWVTWSRPCASVRNASERSRVHFTGRPTRLRRPQRHDFFGIDENLRAEAAADVRRDHAQLVLRRHADEGGDDEARDVRVLRWCSTA